MMNITRTACAKTCQHGATFIVETPAGYVDVMEVDAKASWKVDWIGPVAYFFSMILEGWRYEWRLDRPKQLTRNGKSRLAAKFARECYGIGEAFHWQSTGVERVERWHENP